MADKFYQQVIETENYNIRLGFTSKDPTVTAVDIVSQHNHQKMLFCDPADLQMNNVNGKPAHLVFHADSVQKTNVEDSVLVKIDPHFSKALRSKIDYERLSPYFAFRPKDGIQHTLRQTTQSAKPTIHYPMECNLRSNFKC
jgi:UDP-3-O-[3-hydroxymyristoyl] glucosamine N-acyltransferase